MYHTLLGTEDTMMNTEAGFPALVTYVLTRETMKNNHLDVHAFTVEISALKKKYIGN